ncbi:probable cytochrome P450 6a19 [Ixodes scapularis]|uniref:probable cytochrome P450 6a19 n=1 Tax=Ixodes scapularis TaxID=6945 RepID=UPI001C383A6F|nr:probable cytochrome P450 6a19 [Ixodes scapularis]
MGKHPDVQEKMRTEVMQAAQNGPLAYEDITGLVYTQQVLNETMRLHPAVVAFTTRRALEDYAYGDLVIRKGTSVLASTYQIHHDPTLWPEPDKFDPERFSPENKASIPANAFLPFGVGPKHCLGQRLAQLELAFITAMLLRRFRITLGPSQKPDMEYVTYAMLAAPKNGVWIKLQKLEA